MHVLSVFHLHFPDEKSLTNELKVGRGRDLDRIPLLDAPPIRVLMIDDRELFALREASLVCRAAGEGVYSASSGACGAKQ